MNPWWIPKPPRSPNVPQSTPGLGEERCRVSDPTTILFEITLNLNLIFIGALESESSRKRREKKKKPSNKFQQVRVWASKDQRATKKEIIGMNCEWNSSWGEMHNAMRQSVGITPNDATNVYSTNTMSGSTTRPGVSSGGRKRSHRVCKRCRRDPQ